MTINGIKLKRRKKKQDGGETGARDHVRFNVFALFPSLVKLTINDYMFSVSVNIFPFN